MISKLLGAIAIIVACIMTFLTAFNIAAIFAAMRCEARWEGTYEWKYERPNCKIKIDGKWIPEEYFRVVRR